MNSYKIAVVPDIHGRTSWKELYADIIDDVEYIVFLGDYVDSFYETDDIIYNNLKDIINFKEENDEKVILLLGNHDVQYIYNKFFCSGYRTSMSNSLNKIFNNNIHLFEYYFSFQNLLFTHAGVTKEWLEWANLKDLNHFKNSADSLDIYKLCSVGKSSGGSKISGPLWARPSDYIKDYIDKDISSRDPNGIYQIVGHTETDSLKTYNDYVTMDILKNLQEPIIIKKFNNHMEINYAINNSKIIYDLFHSVYI